MTKATAPLPFRTGIYAEGGSAHRQWHKEFTAACEAIESIPDGLRTSADGFVGLDPEKVPEKLASYYSQLVSMGVFHGWL